MIVLINFFNFILFDIGLVFIFQNIFLLMCIFWLLSFIGDKYFKNKFYKASKEVYECGFLSTHKLKVMFNLSFFLIACLLILYDVEFLFLIPFYFNFSNLTLTSLIIYWIFYIFILVSFIIDWESVSLAWLV